MAVSNSFSLVEECYSRGIYYTLLRTAKIRLKMFLAALSGMRHLGPQPGIEPISPALEGRVLTTGPPGKSLV